MDEKTKEDVLVFLVSNHHKSAMKSYIANLKAQASLQQEFDRIKAQQPKAWEPLESQISRWWINLPNCMKTRPFHISEIAAMCFGKYRDRPALREIGATLRTLGWQEIRIWSKDGPSKRLWQPTQQSTPTDIK